MKQFILWLVCLLFICPVLRADSGDILNRKIEFAQTKSTVYDALNQLSKQTSYLFIYDSNLINNEKKVKIQAGEYIFEQLVRIITGNDKIQMKLKGNYILLFQTQAAPIPVNTPPDTVLKTSLPLIIEGTVRDKQNSEVIPYCSVCIPDAGIGIISNQNGQFLLKLPDSLQHLPVYFSHIGYEPQQIPAQLLIGGNADFYMETRVVPIQEIIVRMINPERIVKEMLEKRAQNYSDSPVYLTSFYREGIERSKGFVSLTEAVFKIYKTEYNNNLSPDQVKLLKMRRISNEQVTDTVILKMKAGIKASLLLDLIKNLPDFLDFDNYNPYTYSKIDMVVTDSSLAHVIAFEQKPGINKPLYKGELYINAQNAALQRAHFEVDPRYIGEAEEFFIVKKSRSLKIKPYKATYTVSYKYWNNKYHINHIRGDISFRIKRKNQLFSSTIHTYFEMATCKIEGTGVTRFQRKESIPVHNIFSETHFGYDYNFWKDFNVILPEEKLNEAISRISSRIEESCN